MSEPLGYNRYFKVAAYGDVIKGDYKSVASTLEFVEEYDLMEYIEIIKRYDRSTAVSYSNAVSYSTAVSGSFGIYKCQGVFESLFCAGKNGICRYIFNKKSTKKRVEEISKNLKKFDWVPSFANWYDINGNKEWWAFCFPQLENVKNADAWAKIPAEMLEYIKSLPEFDEAVWKKITE